MCPYETPEGERVGLVTNLALTANVSLPIPSHEIISCGLLENLDSPLTHRFLVILNGRIMGSCKDAFAFKKKFNEFRLKKLVDPTTSLVWQRYANELHIWSDEGRLYRPLFSVNHENKVNTIGTFKELVASSDIVFRDVQELEQAVVAMSSSDLRKYKCEYMEICPAASMMSVMASVIPFANHSQSPRNAYQSSMGKQAIGIPSEAFQYRYDTTLHVLDYAQQQLTKSEMVNVIKFNEMNHGAMPIVAIMTFNGFNQEDSIILNRASIERGLFSSTTYFTIVEEEKKRGNADFETICLPKRIYRKLLVFG
jgi:DNA-directed RNA polymerase II subunit RPB2